MNLKLEIEFSKAELLQEVDALKKQIDDMRPLPEDVEGRVMQKLRLDWNYHSNAIEGNRLSYGETVAFLMEGITAKGKPLKDHLDIRGHNEAINFLLSIVKDTRPISEADIRALHEMILVEPYNVKAQTTDGLPTTKRITLGEYKTLPNHVKTATGETHYYATPEETAAKMCELMEWYTIASENPEIHPVVLAALFHHKFVSIHPFDDGNGRLSRILMNLILMQKGYPPVVVKMDDRQNYYSLLSRADNAENWPFIEYISELLINSLNIYLKAAQGGDINEDEDIDKDIALFKMGLKNAIDLTDKKSAIVTDRVLREDILPLIQKILNKAKSFDELFFENDKFCRYRYKLDNGNSTSFRRNIIDDKVAARKSSLIDYSKLEFQCYYKEFKNSKRLFGIDLELDVIFDSHTYLVYDFTRENVIKKYYHEHIRNDEQQKIVKSFVETLKKKINDSLSQQRLES